MSRNTLALAFAFALGCTATTQAAITYVYVTDQAVYSTTPGGTVDVDFFLRETVTAPDSTILADPAEAGLTATGFDIQASNGATITGVTLNVNTTGSRDPDTEFASSLEDPLGGSTWSASLAAQFADLSGPIGVTAGSGVREVFLGTFTITAGSATSVVTIDDISDPNTSVTFGTSPDFIGTELDPFFGPAASFTVLVPEPGAALLMVVGLALIGLRPRRVMAVNTAD